jgi:glycerol-3-phosphate dehydrogenase
VNQTWQKRPADEMGNLPSSNGHETSDRFDVIVIGAGINGAGIARDATLRGLRVLILDKGDVAGGTTSWSTRLIHGGLRYLEHGEIGLVRDCCQCIGATSAAGG